MRTFYAPQLPSHPQDIVNGRVDMSEAQFAVDRRLFRDEHYDVQVLSAHTPGLPQRLKGVTKMVAVVSYVPELSGPEWPAFYTHLCMADAIAGDSHVLAQLEQITLPAKQFISLDGVSFRPEPAATPVPKEDLVVRVWNASPDTIFWNRWCDYAARKLPIVEVTAEPDRANTIGIAFTPIGPALALRNAQRVRFLTVPGGYATDTYFDCRQTHTVHRELEKIIHLQGAAAVPQIEQAFQVFFDELYTLLDHRRKVPLWTFESNVNLYERIFHSLNRAT